MNNSGDTTESNTRPWQRPSVIALLLANAVPLVGVMFWHWEVFPLMLLFWSENVVVGLFNALKMLTVAAQGGAVNIGSGLFMIPFFCVHYGMFTLVHGVFVVAMFGGGLQPRGFPSPDYFWSAITEYHLQWAIVGLAASHGFSFIHNFLMNGEYRRTNVQTQMFQPYGRIVVLHIAILVGGGLTMALGSPTVGLLILVLLKTGFDLAAHLRERSKFAIQNAKAQTSL